jgi:hypothetical protein
MKPKSKKESYWRMTGYEYRHLFKKGTKAGKAARNFTRNQCNKAMRFSGKVEIEKQMDEYDAEKRADKLAEILFNKIGL